MAIEVKLPDIGEGIEHGTVVGILVKVGDKVERDQPLVELETDKAVVEVPSTAAGVVSQINVTENEEAAVGSVLVVLDEGAGQEAGAAAPAEPAAAAPPADEQSTEAPRPAPSAPATEPAQRPAPAAEGQGAGRPAQANGLVPAAPSIRRLARELGVDIHHVPGTGVMGRISAQDVRAAVGTPAPAGAVQAPPAFELPDFSRWGATERSPMSGVRKATVRSMTTAWSTVPMVTHFDKADVTELEATRRKYQQAAEAAGGKLTPTAIMLKVVAAALRKFPDFNASIDVVNQEVIHKRYINIGVAVDTDAGLLVPVVKDVDRKNLIELAVELGELAEKARSRKLSMDEMQGGNFSISNLGGIGGHGFTPIVNPPDVAILGVSRSSVEPVWNKERGEFQPRTLMPLALTYDHRLIDGAAAARFLRWVCRTLEEPFLLALEG